MSYEAVQRMLIKMKKTARFKLLTALFVIFSILLTSILSYLAWLKFISFSSMMATSVLLIIINAVLLIWWQRSNTPSDTSKKEVLANVARELITLLNLLERKEKLINKNLSGIFYYEIFFKKINQIFFYLFYNNDFIVIKSFS